MTAPTGGTLSPRNVTGSKLRYLPKYGPQGQEIYNRLFGGLTGGQGVQGGLDFLSRLAMGDESAYADAEAPAYRGFDKALGKIGQRFSNLGAMDSSGFQQATSGAAQELAENLQAKRLGLRQSAIDSLLGLSKDLMGSDPYEPEVEDEGGFDWASLLGSLGGAALSGVTGGMTSGISSGVLRLLQRLFGGKKGG